MSGAAIQGLSRVMWEQNSFNKERITSLDWASYEALRNEWEANAAKLAGIKEDAVVYCQ